MKRFRSLFKPPSASKSLKRALRPPSASRALKKAFRLPSPSKALRKAFQPSPTARGRKGENKVASKLGWRLGSSEYHRFHDVHLPSAFGATQIDHVVVSRYGVFVIETKNYSGWIFGSENSKVWTQVLYGEKHKFQNPLRQNYKHTKAIESFLSLHSSVVFSVIVFVGSSEFRTAVPPNVIRKNGLIRYIRSKTNPMIPDAKVEWIVDRLGRHQDGLPARSQESGSRHFAEPEPNCPVCGEQMAVRTARKGKSAGQRFLGCSRFPSCRGTRNLDAF